MRVFILCTGRNGSYTFIEACKYITNYTCGHESLSSEFGDSRIDYPDNHIEADNRLSWMLGRLEESYGDRPFYIHFIRDKEATAKSYLRRFYMRDSIIRSYSEGILMTPPESLSYDQKLSVSRDYYKTVDANIRAFIKSKSKKMTIQLDQIEEDFKKFWDFIGAEGDLDKAIEVFKTKYNPSEVSLIRIKKYQFKQLGKRLWYFLKNINSKI